MPCHLEDRPVSEVSLFRRVFFASVDTMGMAHGCVPLVCLDGWIRCGVVSCVWWCLNGDGKNTDISATGFFKRYLSNFIGRSALSMYLFYSFLSLIVLYIIDRSKTF